MNNIPTAEEFCEKWRKAAMEGITNSSIFDGPSLLEEYFKEFAKLHVKAALQEAKDVQHFKYMAGETGYLKKDDWELIYPENLIK